ncbi:MAG: ATP-dependent zinc metalloprotease FtsH [Gammaproteobacteria bacterium]|nr:ATP-dependent zinc metalloprotease FtsH [Gammaproteobacteria bacterium]
MERKTQFNAWYILLAILGVFLLQDLWIQSQSVEHIPYSEFQALLEQGEVEAIEIRERRIHGKLRNPTADGRDQFVTTRVDPALANDLAQYGTEFTGVVETHLFANVLSWVLPILVFFGLWVFIFRKLAEKQGGLGGFMTVGKSKAKVYMEQDTKVTFDDVAGVDEAKKELEEVVAFLQRPDEYGRLGARMPKGILLVGPPGTGKTLFARAVAGEAKVPFFSINGSEFVEMFVGVGAARVRDLFEQARQKAPCIIFIDELDALGRARGAFPGGGGHDEKEQTLNQLLAELDGFDPGQGVVLLAATNRPEILDPALLRPGRFDRHVLVERPDRAGRVAILDVHIKRISLGDDVDIEAVASITPGFSGADLANLVNEAAVVATRRDAPAVAMEDFNNAMERMVAGLEKKNRLLNPHEREVVAYHEAGHAMVAVALPGTDPVHKISIIPRGIGALGYTIQRPTEDRYLMTREELENKLAVLFGGRAAELLIFEELSTGAADDLNKATDIARSMVTRYGMDSCVGQMTYEGQGPAFLNNGYGARPERREYSEETAREIDCAVRDIITAAFERATETLIRHRKLLIETAQKLLEKETLTAEELPDLHAIEKKVAASAT